MVGNNEEISICSSDRFDQLVSICSLLEVITRGHDSKCEKQLSKPHPQQGCGHSFQPMLVVESLHAIKKHQTV